MQLALDGNPTVKALEYEEKAAKRERQAAIGLFMPKINVRGVYTYLGKDIKIDLNNGKGAVSDMANQTISTIMQNPTLAGIIQPMLPDIQSGLNSLLGLDWAYTIQNRSFGFVGGDVTMPIFMGGKIITANKAAKLNESAVKEQGSQVRNALMSEVVERYFGYALALNAVDVRKQVVAGMEQHLRDIESLEKNGMVAQTERLYVEYKLNEARRDLQNAELQAETIGNALCNTLGTDAVSIPVSAMFVLDTVPRWAVGVGFSFKIFDGLNREYKYSAARNTVRRVEQLKVKADKDISVLIESLYSKMLNYRNQISSIESSIAFAEEYLRAKNAAYVEGMATSTDLIDAELNLAKVRIERMQAAYNFDVSLAKLLEAAGISEEFIGYSRSANARHITYRNNN